MDDRTAIQSLISTYSQAASVGDWDAVLATYQPDAVWDIPHLGLRLEGRDAILDALKGMIVKMDYVIQMNSPALIEVDGGTARARSAIRECGKSKAKNEGFEFLGFYVDDLVKTGQGWKFARRVFAGKGTHYFPLLSGNAH